MPLTLWYWSVRNDEWEVVTQANEDDKKKVLRTHKRRHPKGAKFRWTTGDKPKKFRTRAKKEKA